MVKRKTVSRFPPVTTMSTISANSNQARIKKIMQSDEEVGKIATGTPIVICKDFFKVLNDFQLVLWSFSLKCLFKKPVKMQKLLERKLLARRIC